MKPIEIKKIETYTSFVTRQGKPAKLVKYLPTADVKTRLLFLVDDKVLGCDEEGKCWVINGIDSSIVDSPYYGFDVFVDEKMSGWINLNVTDKLNDKSILTECSPVIYRTQGDALVNATEKTFKTIRIEWRL